MREVIRAMSESGIRAVDYATGYSRRLDSAVRQNILWGVRKCNRQTAKQTGEGFGADGCETSGSFAATKRTYAVIPDTEGDSIDAYTYSGTLRAKSEVVDGTATSADGWETCTFTEDSE